MDMGYGWLNFASLFLGLAGWALPVLSWRRVAGGRGGSVLPGVLGSMGCCGLALWCQIRYGLHLIQIEDFSALMDTWGAVSGVALFLLVSTGLLNLITLLGAGATSPGRDL